MACVPLTTQTDHSNDRPPALGGWLFWVGLYAWIPGERVEAGFLTSEWRCGRRELVLPRICRHACEALGLEGVKPGVREAGSPVHPGVQGASDRAAWVIVQAELVLPGKHPGVREDTQNELLHILVHRKLVVHRHSQCAFGRGPQPPPASSSGAPKSSNSQIVEKS